MVSLQKSNEEYESESFDENWQNPGHEFRWSISEVGLERETSTIWSKSIANYGVALKIDCLVSVYVSLLIICVAQQPKSGLGFLNVDVPGPHTFRHTSTRQESSERVISRSQMPLLAQHTADTRDEHPRSQRHSYLPFHQSSGYIPTP